MSKEREYEVVLRTIANLSWPCEHPARTLDAVIGMAKSVLGKRSCPYCGKDFHEDPAIAETHFVSCENAAWREMGLE